MGLIWGIIKSSKLSVYVHMSSSHYNSFPVADGVLFSVQECGLYLTLRIAAQTTGIKKIS